MIIRSFFVVLLIFKSLIGSSQIVDDTFHTRLRDQYSRFSWNTFKQDPNNLLYINGDFKFVNGQPFDGTHLKFTENLMPDLSFAYKGSIEGFQRSGKIISINTISTDPILNQISRFNPDGTEDESFNKVVINGPFEWIHIENNDHILVTGRFSEANGELHRTILRLDEDGNIENELDLGIGLTFASFFNQVATQSDGKIIVMGAGTYQEQNAPKLFRVNIDGSVDDTFTTGNPQDIKKIRVLEDDKIIVAGNFSEYNGVPLQNIVRLMPDGSIDDSFIGPSFKPDVYTDICSFDIDEQNIVIGGEIVLDNDLAASVIRLNQDGSLDNSFQPLITDTNSSVRNIHITDDRRLVIGGIFSEVDENPSNGLAFVNSDGSINEELNLELEFIPGVLDAIALDNGKVLINKSSSTRINDTEAPSLVVLDQNGNIDDSFIGLTPESGVIRYIEKFGDGLLIGGTFDSVDGINNNGIVLLKGDGTVNNEFSSPFAFGSYVDDIDIHNNQIYVSGDLYDFEGNRTQFAKLNTNGERDNSFNGSIVDSDIGFGAGLELLFMADDKKLVAGFFIQDFENYSEDYLYLLNPDWSINKVIDLPIGNIPASLFLLDNGNAIVNNVVSVNGIEQDGIAILDKNGMLVEEFNFSGFENEEIIMAIPQEGNKLTALTRAGNEKNMLRSVNEDGSIELSVELPTTVSDFFNYEKDRFLVTGSFYQLGGGNNEGLAIVNLIQQSPTVGDIEITIDEDTRLFLAASLSDSYYDPNLDPLQSFRYTSELVNAHIFLGDQEISMGQEVMGSDIDSLSLVPDENFFGTINFPFELSDGISFSNTAQFNVAVLPVDDEITSLDEQNSRLGVYPNPFQDMINVTSLGQDITSVSITTSSGKVLFTGDQETRIINTESFPKGLYIMNIYTEQDQFNLRLVKH
ncbi:MAG: T9SS type A sorting domain-containing protein [Bacteroidota bacterium]